MAMALVINQVLTVLPDAAIIASASKIIGEYFPFHGLRPNDFDVRWLQIAHIWVDNAAFTVVTLPPSVDSNACPISKAINID